jgi:hypothetical protein
MSGALTRLTFTLRDAQHSGGWVGVRIVVDRRFVDFRAIVIEHDHRSIAIVALNVFSDLASDIIGNRPGLRVAAAILADRIFESKSIDNFEMIFWHLQPPSSTKTMLRGRWCSENRSERGEGHDGTINRERNSGERIR